MSPLYPLLTGTLIGVHFWRIRKDGGLSRPPDKFRPDPYRVVQRSDTKESFAPGVKRTYGLMELVRGTCPTVDKGPYNYVFTWPHLLRAELNRVHANDSIGSCLVIYQCPF